MSDLIARPLAGLVLVAAAGCCMAATLLDGLRRHSTLARILLLFGCLASVALLAMRWKPGMQPFRHPLAALVLACASAALCTAFWSSAGRGPRTLAAILLLASSVAFALAPTVAWPWRQAQSPWFLWSEILYALSAGALWACAVRANVVADDSSSLSTVAAALLAQTVALLLLGVGAQVAWGAYWTWDPIESWRLAAWLATTALAIVLGQLGWRRRRAWLATSLVAAFALLVLWGAFPLVHWLGLASAYLPN